MSLGYPIKSGIKVEVQKVKKIKYRKRITIDEVDSIFHERFNGKSCSSCGSSDLFPGSIESQYDEAEDAEVLLSFCVFCKSCGHLEPFRYDNMFREYFFK